MAPAKVTSRKSGVNTLTTRNRSASAVLEEIVSLGAIGPLISTSSKKGSDIKVSPSPSASKLNSVAGQ